jgi:hypothetical protein
MENKKWYAIQYEEGYWAIQDYNGVDQLWEGDSDNTKAIGAEQAEKNAKLCAAAPEIRQLLGLMYGAIRMPSGAIKQELEIDVMNKCEQLLKQLTT